jgi:hypothetical protein
MTQSIDVSTQVTSEVKQQLRELNKATHPVQVALNQARICLDRAAKLMEENYHRKRHQIINGYDS